MKTHLACERTEDPVNASSPALSNGAADTRRGQDAAHCEKNERSTYEKTNLTGRLETAQGSTLQERSTVNRTLADLPDAATVDIEQLAHALDRCTKSIERAVRRGELPAPFKLCGRRVWLASAINEHLQARQSAALEQQKRHVARMAKLN